MRLEREKSDIVKSAIQLSFYYRGGIPYDQAMFMSGYERRLAIQWHDEYIKNELKVRPQAPNY